MFRRNTSPPSPGSIMRPASNWCKGDPEHCLFSDILLVLRFNVSWLLTDREDLCICYGGICGPLTEGSVEGHMKNIRLCMTLRIIGVPVFVRGAEWLSSCPRHFDACVVTHSVLVPIGLATGSLLNSPSVHNRVAFLLQLLRCRLTTGGLWYLTAISKLSRRVTKGVCAA